MPENQGLSRRVWCGGPRPSVIMPSKSSVGTAQRSAQSGERSEKRKAAKEGEREKNKKEKKKKSRLTWARSIGPFPCRRRAPPFASPLSVRSVSGGSVSGGAGPAARASGAGKRRPGMEGEVVLRDPPRALPSPLKTTTAGRKGAGVNGQERAEGGSPTRTTLFTAPLRCLHTYVLNIKAMF